jgi:hypothetical protein
MRHFISTLSVDFAISSCFGKMGHGLVENPAERAQYVVRHNRGLMALMHAKRAPYLGHQFYINNNRARQVLQYRAFSL